MLQIFMRNDFQFAIDFYSNIIFIYILEINNGK
jgi:hypothetical protein